MPNRLTHEEVDKQVMEALNPTKQLKSFAEKQGVKKTLLGMASGQSIPAETPGEPMMGNKMTGR